MKKLFSLTLSLLMLIACSMGTVSAFAAEGEEPTPVDLRDCTVTLQYASATYTGKALRPTVKVRYNDIALVQGQDYKVQYSANTACGTAQVKLTGTGDYTGAVSRSFKILPGRVTGMSTSRTTTTITINWKQVPGTAVYRVYQSTSAIIARLPLSAAPRPKSASCLPVKNTISRLLPAAKRTAPTPVPLARY